MSDEKAPITIPDPCSAPWDEMHDQGTSRFCDHCTTDVHDLSQFTREEALALIEHGGDHICVRYLQIDDEIFFKDSTSPVWRLSRQLEGAKKLLAAAALVVPMLAACDSAPQDTKPEAVTPTPISIDAGGASLKPGAGVSPTFDDKPAPTPVDDGMDDHVVGKVAIDEPVEKPEAPKIKRPKPTRPKTIVVGKPAIKDPKDLKRFDTKKGMVRKKIGKPAIKEPEMIKGKPHKIDW